MINDPKPALRQAYNAKADERDATKIQPWKAAARQSFLDQLQQAGAKTLLELGAGVGRDSLFFQENGLEVTCIDLSPELVKRCRQKGLNARVLAFGDLDYAPNSFDAVFALNSLLHVPKAELPSLLETIYSILSVNGLFFMGVWGGPDSEQVWKQDSYDPPRFFAFYPDETIQTIVSEHFEILSFDRVEDLRPDNRIHFQSIIMKR